MYYKLFTEPAEGDYISKITGDRCTLVSAPEVITPEGGTNGWYECDTEEEAMTYYKVWHNPQQN